MRNTTLFAILVAGILAVVYLQLARPTRTVVLEGRFTEELEGIDGGYAYLVTEDATGGERRLDSCLICGNRFTLTTDVQTRRLTARVRFARIDLERELQLEPGRDVSLTIRPLDLHAQYEAAVREAIARLDSTGLTLPDSLWQERQERDDPAISR